MAHYSLWSNQFYSQQSPIQYPRQAFSSVLSPNFWLSGRNPHRWCRIRVLRHWKSDNRSDPKREICKTRRNCVKHTTSEYQSTENTLFLSSSVPNSNSNCLAVNVDFLIQKRCLQYKYTINCLISWMLKINRQTKQYAKEKNVCNPSASHHNETVDLHFLGFARKCPSEYWSSHQRLNVSRSMEVRTANSPIGNRLNSFFSLIIQLNLNEFSLNQSPAMSLCVLNWICLRRSATPMMFFPHNLHPTTPLWNCKYFHLLEPFSTFCNYCISRIFLSAAIAQIVMWMN